MPPGQPLTHVRSDADGFFSLDLPPGIYTLKLAVANHGFPMPDTVTVEAGQDSGRRRVRKRPLALPGGRVWRVAREGRFRIPARAAEAAPR